MHIFIYIYIYMYIYIQHTEILHDLVTSTFQQFTYAKQIGIMILHKILQKSYFTMSDISIGCCNEIQIMT